MKGPKEAKRTSTGVAYAVSFRWTTLRCALGELLSTGCTRRRGAHRRGLPRSPAARSAHTLSTHGTRQLSRERETHTPAWRRATRRGVVCGARWAPFWQPRLSRRRRPRAKGAPPWREGTTQASGCASPPTGAMLRGTSPSSASSWRCGTRTATTRICTTESGRRTSRVHCAPAASTA